MRSGNSTTVLDFILRNTDLNVWGMHRSLILFFLKIAKQNDYFGGKKLNSNRKQVIGELNVVKVLV